MNTQTDVKRRVKASVHVLSLHGSHKIDDWLRPWYDKVRPTAMQSRAHTSLTGFDKGLAYPMPIRASTSGAVSWEKPQQIWTLG